MKRSLGKLLGMGALALGLSSSPARAADTTIHVQTRDAQTELPAPHIDYAYIFGEGTANPDTVFGMTDENGSDTFTYDIVTGVGNTSSPFFFDAQNTSTDGQLRFTLESPDNLETLINIYDVTGRRVGGGNQEGITLKHTLPSGVYFAQANHKGNKPLTEKIIALKGAKAAEINNHYSSASMALLGTTARALISTDTGDGYNELDQPVTINAGEDNYHNYPLSPEGVWKTLSASVWDNTDTTPLAGDTLNVLVEGRTNPYVGVIDPAGNVSIDYVADAAQTISIFISGNAEYAGARGNIYDPSLPSTQGLLATANNFQVNNDTLSINSDEPLLQSGVHINYLRQSIANNPTFQDALLWNFGQGTQTREGDAYQQEVLTNEYHLGGAVGGSIAPQDLENLMTVATYKNGLLTRPNGRVLIPSNVVQVPQPTGGFDKAYLFIDNSGGPANGMYISPQGVVEMTYGHVQTGNGLGTMAAELFNAELKDINDDMVYAITGEGTLTPIALEAFCAYHQFPSGTIFKNYSNP